MRSFRILGLLRSSREAMLVQNAGKAVTWRRGTNVVRRREPTFSKVTPLQPRRRRARRHARTALRTVSGASRPVGRLQRRAQTILLIIAYGALLFVGNDFRKGVFPAAEFEGVVRRVVDGDTLHMTSVAPSIRLWGVDAPEVGEAGGDDATRTLKEIAHGEKLWCEQITIDRYRRVVARCYLDDGRSLDALMIASGTAREYIRFTGGYYAMRRLAGDAIPRRASTETGLD